MDDRMKYLPLTFMLGFFVTTVFERWRSALNVMPFIESVALSVAVLLPGKGEEDRLTRRAIIRYVVLHQVNLSVYLFIQMSLFRYWCSVISRWEFVVASPLFNRLWMLVSWNLKSEMNWRQSVVVRDRIIGFRSTGQTR